jgi:hypothetical protein
MTAIVHRTPGLIDIRAFTTMGLSAKVGTNPIGMFGTGLKYAIAVLVRNGARPVVWIGRDRYEFFCQGTKFRDKEFQLVRMKRQTWSLYGLGRPRTIDLPFTTEYGRNWEMWMAFRELEANTRDEGGITDMLPEEAGRDVGQDGFTTIVIDHPAYVEAWQNRDDVFLPGGQSVRLADEGLQLIQEPSQRVYYRGLRAMDVSKPTLFTYNILAGLDLTEDRTFKHEFQVRDIVARHVLVCDDAALIERFVTADKDVWEHGMDFPRWQKPSEAFRAVAEARPRGASVAMASYYVHHDRRPATPVENIELKHKGPWRLSEDQDEVLDADGQAVFAAPYGYEGRWGPTGLRIISGMGMETQPEPESAFGPLEADDEWAS